MGLRSSSIVVLGLVLLVRSSIAAIITVGDSLGWTNFDLSTQRVPDYAAWAASQPVAPGDSLVFKYAPGFHNVAQLPTKTDFDNCNFAKATMLDNGSSGNFTWTAPQKTGVYYFACGFSVEGQGTHCDGGQKVSITVTALAGAPSRAPSPSKAPGKAPTPAALFVPATSPSSRDDQSPSASPQIEATSPPIISPGMGIVPAGQVSPTTPGTSAQTPSASDTTSDAAAPRGPSFVAWSLIMMIAATAAALRL